MRAMKKRKWMIQKENMRKCPNKIMMVGKEEVDYEYVYLLCFTQVGSLLMVSLCMWYVL